MEITFTPEICSGDTAEYSGQIVMKMPTYIERLEIYESQGLDLSGGKEGIESEAKKKGLSMLKHAASQLPKYVMSVDIIRKSDGFKFDSLELLSYDSDLGPVMQECALKLVGRFNVGNPSIPR